MRCHANGNCFVPLTVGSRNRENRFLMLLNGSRFRIVDFMSYFRPNVDQIHGYAPGEQPQESGWIKLNTNENPYPPSPKVIEALQERIQGRLNIYPDPLATNFRKLVGERFGVDPDWVLPANGSDENLTLIMRSFIDPHERVVYPYPSYILYETLVQLQGGGIRTSSAQSGLAMGPCGSEQADRASEVDDHSESEFSLGESVERRRAYEPDSAEGIAGSGRSVWRFCGQAASGGVVEGRTRRTTDRDADVQQVV